MAPIPQHVPAWKKLGLKLKYAKDDADEVPQVSIPERTKPKDSGQNKKRKSPENGEILPSEIVSRRQKRSKKSHEFNVNEQADSNGKAGDTAPKKLPAPVGSPVRKRKSVSFTPETKVEDGEGIKHTYREWLKTQEADDPTFDASRLNQALRPHKSKEDKSVNEPEPEAEGSDQASSEQAYSGADNGKIGSTSSASTPQPKASKKSKKKQDKPKEKSKKPKEDIDPSSPHLTYLTLHHTDPTSWKFSKTNQNHILKHLYSFRQIPSSYDPALLSYLKGLKGRSVRQRTRIEALEIRKSDEESLSTIPDEPPNEDATITTTTNFQETKTTNPDTTMSTTPTPPPDSITDPARHARNRAAYLDHLAQLKRQLKLNEAVREDVEWEFLGGKAEWEHRLRKRRRAEIVLWGIGEEEEEAAEEQKKTKEGERGREAMQQQQPPRNIGQGGMNGQARQHAGANGGVVAATAPLPPTYGRGMQGFHDPDAVKANVLTLAAGKKIVFGESNQGSSPPKTNGVAATPAVDGGSEAPARKSVRVRRSEQRRRRKLRRTGVPDDDDDESSSSSESSGEERRKRAKLGEVETMGKGGKGEVRVKTRVEMQGAGDDGSSGSGSGSGSSGSGDSDGSDDSDDSD